MEVGEEKAFKLQGRGTRQRHRKKVETWRRTIKRGAALMEMQRPKPTMRRGGPRLASGVDEVKTAESFCRKGSKLTHSSSQNELGDVDRLALQGHSAQHEDAPDEDALFPAEHVAYYRSDGQSEEGADVLDGRHDACSRIEAKKRTALVILANTAREKKGNLLPDRQETRQDSPNVDP